MVGHKLLNYHLWFPKKILMYCHNPISYFKREIQNANFSFARPYFARHFNFYFKMLDHSYSTKNIEIPNEIWLKIMNYLPTEDIFGTFVRLNKRLNGIATDPKALKYLSFKRLETYSRNFFDPAMKVLNRSTGLVGLSLINCDKWKKTITQVSYSNIVNLKSLEVSIDDDGYFCDYDHCDEYHGTTFPFQLIQALNGSKIELQTLKIKGFLIDDKVMFEISKMKSLKTLSILDAKQQVLTPNILESLAISCNQLENIEIYDREKTKYNQDDDDYDFSDDRIAFYGENVENNYKTALNTLFEEKSSTLKSIKIFNLGESYCRRPKKQCVPLTNLTFCQNLE